MALLTVNGMVTRYANYKESDRILTLLTREYGFLTVSARGCRRPKSPLLASAELFSYGEFVLFSSNGKYSLNACDLREAFYPIREDVDKYAAGAYMLSLVNECEIGERSDELLSLLYHTLSFLAYADNHPLDLALCFAVKLLALLGFTPALVYCAKCGQDLRVSKSLHFSAPAGGALCPNCAAGAAPVSRLSLEALRRMLLLSHTDIRKVVLPEQVRRELKSIVNSYAEYTLEHRFKALDGLSAASLTEISGK